MPDSAQFLAGFAKRSILPDLSKGAQWLAGYFPARLGFAAHDDISVRCLVLKDRFGASIVIVSAELIGLLPKDVEDIRGRVAHVFSGKLFLHTTHTHSAPDTMGFWGPNIYVPLATGKEDGYMRFMKSQVIECIKDAARDVLPASISFSETVLANVSRGPKHMAADDTVSLMLIRSSRRSVFLVNFAMHPDVLKSNYITGDWVYFMNAAVERASGGDSIFINGAIGGVRPAHRGDDSEHWQRAKYMGEAVAHAALVAAERALPSKSGRIRYVSTTFGVAVENKNFARAATRGLIEDQRGPDGLIPVEVNYLEIGDAGILTYPGEVFPSVASPLKDELPQKFRFTFGLTNGELGYILRPEDYNSGKYPYHSDFSVGSTIGERISRVTHDLIEMLTGTRMMREEERK